MPFSYEQTIAVMNNAVNELTRAARDFGDERPDDDPIAVELRELVQHVGEMMTKLTAERDLVAGRGTSEHATVIRDVKRDPDGMASPGHDLPPGVTEATIEKEKARVTEEREAALRAQVAANTPPAVAVVAPVDPDAKPKKPAQ
jgi:hypothetical protein